MDYFGRLVDDLTDMVEAIQDTGNAEEGIAVIRALERAMRAAVEVERARTGRTKTKKIAASRAIIPNDPETKLNRAA